MDEFTALFSRKDMTFEEAVEYFKERVPVTASRFYQIAAEYRAGSGGPSRKYYRLTPDGVQYLNEFTEAWQNASDTVNRILHDKEG